jgi:excisionase family DNA binding protein
MRQKEEALLDPKRLMTPAEAAEMLRCSVDYVWHLCRKDELKHMRKGTRILIRRQDLIEYIASQVRGGK